MLFALLFYLRGVDNVIESIEYVNISFSYYFNR